MSKRIYVKLEDFTVAEVERLVGLGHKFNSKEYLIINGEKAKLEDLMQIKLSVAMKQEEEFKLPPELLDEEEIKENEGGINMKQETIEFNEVERKALINLGFYITDNVLYFNDEEVDYEQQVKIKKELVYLTKYVKIQHSYKYDNGVNFNNYSGYVWVKLIKRDSREKTKVINDIIRGIAMTQYIDISNEKKQRLRNAIIHSNISSDWKDRLISSIKQ